ncbi:mannitol dehydrogenase family protein [Thalassococcus sp. S3]|uniref:mannitol dehydrogenase family protein n=1 Tax=Thalassococcus sp. S3 TaxID=2017482 RepID=UPI0013EE7536|nr:mannitol dehydrogenase family protein [Thalassococcus sp. S3]
MGRILHLGVGNFFRAHQAWYTAQLPDWRITGVSLRSAAVRDGLAGQGCAYIVLIQDVGGSRVERITCLDRILVAPEDPQAVIAAVADDAVEVVTLTVTEKGYHLTPAGKLDESDPAIRADLAGEGPATPVGYLAHGLARRSAPLTVLSCDNLPENGRKLEQAVQRFARLAGLTLPGGLMFPCTMVDRITPATTDAVRQKTGDRMAVPTEDFTEWVIEDDFAGRRPDWPGVQWVADVAPHEMRKLRMLNGAHSYLAYAGSLAGHSFVHEAVADPELRQMARALMAEAADTLPEDARKVGYAESLIRRFENPHLDHRLRQIAMDGSQKMPVRIAATLKDRTGQKSPALEAAVSAWLHFVRRECEAGRTLDDPLADRLADACRSTDPDGALRAIIGL